MRAALHDERFWKLGCDALPDESIDFDVPGITRKAHDVGKVLANGFEKFGRRFEKPDLNLISLDGLEVFTDKANVERCAELIWPVIMDEVAEVNSRVYPSFPTNIWLTK